MIHAKIITHENTVFERNVGQATLPVEDGLVTILPNHIPYVAVLKDGEIIFKDTDSKKEYFMTVYKGILMFSNNELIILAERT